tara:strand:+ start:43 stop:507 length:465 start_codon:yes stop_codon:yes gene_type:complete
MLKKFFYLFLLLFLTSCGYEAMYSKKNTEYHDFSIKELTFTGERNINLRIKSKLNNYTLLEKDKKFILNISSSKEKVILAKNTAGNATSFRSIIKVDAQILIENKFLKDLQIIESFDYDNITNTFDLKNYEKEIINNLSEVASEKLISKLANIQ